MGDKAGISEGPIQHNCIQLAVDSTLIMQMMQADDRIENEVFWRPFADSRHRGPTIV